MFIKLLLAHIVISLLAIPVIAIAGNDAICIALFLISLSLYFLSGYYLTTRRTSWYNYFAVAITGIALWLICYYISPNSTGFKRDTQAGIWFYYEIYTMVKSPLMLITSLNEPYSLRKDLIIKFAIPVIASLAQFAGGMMKQKSFK